jgi:hypothetical protein
MTNIVDYSLGVSFQVGTALHIIRIHINKINKKSAGFFKTGRTLQHDALDLMST